MPATSRLSLSSSLSFAVAAGIVLAGSIALAVHVQAVVCDWNLAGMLVSDGLWRTVTHLVGGEADRYGLFQRVEPTLAGLLLRVTGAGLFAWLVGAAWICRRRGISYRAALSEWGRWGWLWWLLPVLWELMGTAADLSGSSDLHLFWQKTLPLLHCALWAGWLTTFLTLARWPANRDTAPSAARTPALVWGAIGAYFLGFATMNWLLYESLLVPHGDSAMYEEHVWNVLHGKGFRSYLDNGRLFLGEHVQVIHLLVIPLYLAWPSHLLLELCQSACLALGAIPVFRIAQRHSRSSTAATLLAIAYLLYFPMQFLDIAVTFKTFRPNAFEIPILLFAIDALERCRYRLMLFWFGMALLCQEDAAVVIAPLGIWIALRQARFAQVADPRGRRRLAWLGSGLALGGALYVVVVIKVVLPWFRGGADVHFAQYFNDLGQSSSGIVANLLMHPGLLLAKMLNVESALFALALVAPLGFLPLLSPGRLAVAVPLFSILCLSQITNSAVHHFHAPLVAVVFWAAAAGLSQVSTMSKSCAAWYHRPRRSTASDEDRHRIYPESFGSTGKTLPVDLSLAVADRNDPGCNERSPPERGRQSSLDNHAVMAAATWAVLSAFFSGLINRDTFTPLGISFWDPSSSHYWRELYIPGERAKRFPTAWALVPIGSRVASTDYIHPRFTHHARSYDYSDYRPGVQNDAEYIVIDTRHPYSGIKHPDEIKEYREHPDEWELLDDHTDGYFIVLKRRPVKVREDGLTPMNSSGE